MPNPALPRRIDPSYRQLTPLLFAHRGGPLEAPESTERAFRYAWERVGADVLELDVHVTRDGEIVVWHGPGLDNVRIRGVSDDIRQRRSDGRHLITHFAWSELENAAWVADPPECAGHTWTDVSGVPEEADRTLIRLEDLLIRFPDAPMNIEMKASFGASDIPRFLDLLDRHRSSRPLVVASAAQKRLNLFRDLVSARTPEQQYPLSMSIMGNIRVMSGVWLPLVPLPDMQGQSLQTVWKGWVSSRRLVHKVREAGGAVHVFLTHFTRAADALDRCAKDVTDEVIFRILDRGVDGIMTDRPGLVKPILERWKEARA